jgi:hypothetical protein
LAALVSSAIQADFWVYNVKLSGRLNFLMTRTEMVLETLVYSTFNHLKPLIAREYFIEDFWVLYVRGKMRL